MKSQDLNCAYCVLSSDEDYHVVEDLTVGYDDDLNLIILLEHDNYQEPDQVSSTYAIVTKDCAYNLARSLNVGMSALPEQIGESMCHYRKIINPSTGDVKDCFREILAGLDREKIRYRIISSR